MRSGEFKAMVVSETAGGFRREIARKSLEELPAGEVLIEVSYSSLNYKDALSATGNRGVTKSYPHTPGIDAAGLVAESSDPRFAAGEPVLVTGFDLGMNTSGGFARFVRVPAAWVLKLPATLSLREAMIYGTAGFTAANSVYRLQEGGVSPEQGAVLVTGATGGVGSLAVGILARAGYRVTAATGKSTESRYLTDLGAAEVIGREELEKEADRALASERWAGVVDTVGGSILAAALKATRFGGTVATCGNVRSNVLETTVFPFILRAVRLQGIASARCPWPLRSLVWEKIASEWKLDNLELLARQCSLEELDPLIDLILAGKLRGRVVVDLLG